MKFVDYYKKKCHNMMTGFSRINSNIKTDLSLSLALFVLSKLRFSVMNVKARAYFIRGIV